MSLTAEAVRWVAHLSRLELSDGELGTLAHELSAILNFDEQRQQLDPADVQPLAHPLPVENIFREDVPADSLPVHLALANAPERRDNFFGVPAVLD